MKKALGYSMVATPFIGIFLIACRDIGFVQALTTFGAVGLLVVFIGVGLYLVVQ